jgi:Tol biopolymer transport system component
MALAPGTRIGHYDVVAALGAGGMGEVYRARDPRLGREVAIKVVAGDGAQDPVRRARFEQEARAAAALNHPHILAVYDVGEAVVHGMPTPFVVSELLDGESLRARLASGPLPPRAAIDLAIQIAKALAAAHEHGIVHRDLKPENLFLTKDGTVKVLDFGLAKLREHEWTIGDGATTLGGAAVSTERGVVLGTVGYMAPEQVRAEPVDGRADLFALGCVLYELVSGQRAFQAATPVESLSAILTTEPPDLSARCADLPGGLDRIVRRCLAKDRAQRFQSARDLAFALEAVAETRSATGYPAVASTTTSQERPWWERLAWMALAVATFVGGGLVANRPEGATDGTGILRLDVDLSGAHETGGGFALSVSPDGRTVIAVVSRDGRTRLVARDLRSGELREVPNTEGATSPIEWAPGGRAILYRDGSSLKRRDLAATVSTDVLAGDAARIGARVSYTEAGSGDVLVVDTQRAVIRIPGQGGSPAPVDLKLPDGHLADHVAFLPDSQHYLVSTSASGRGALFLADLGADTPRHVAGDVGGRVVLVPPDILVFSRQSTLLAQRIDLVGAHLVGTPVQLAEEAAEFAASADAVVFTVQRHEQLTWHDRRTGARRPLGAPGRFQTLDLSRDGRTVVVSAQEGGSSSLWLVDAELGGLTRLTSGATLDIDPRWSPSGDQVIFGSRRAPGRAPFKVGVRDLAISPVFPFAGNNFSLDDWSADGRWLVYHDAGVPRLFARRIDPPGEPVLVAQSAGGAIDQARLSPDGTLLAFNSDDSGRFEVFVAPFPAAGPRVRVSKAGGVQPTWRADGRELYFLQRDGTLLAVAVTPGVQPEFGEPTALLPMGSITSGTTDEYAPAPDGQRFVSIQPVESTIRRSFSVIVNWRHLMAPDRSRRGRSAAGG